MCGIAGFFSGYFDDRLEILKGLELRGRDGFGCLAWAPKAGSKVTKTLEPVSKFLDSKSEYELANGIGLNFMTVIANTRAIPSTEFHIGAGADLENQQPFENERFALVFNGLISNDKELIKQYDLKPGSVVDTAMLIPLFEKIGVKEGLKLLKGPFALIIIDKKEKIMYFGRNFMPLVYKYIEREELLIASTKEMMEQTPGSYIEVPPYTMYKFDLNKGKFIESFSLYKKEPNKKVMVIFSGGMDSVVTAYLYKRLGFDLTLVHFNYGQAAETVEEDISRKIARKLNAKISVHDAKSLFEIFKKSSKLLSQKQANESEQSLDAESTLSYVPNRNAILAMIVAGMAEAKGCDTVTFGGQQMDSVYPDNTPDFVKKINDVLKYALNWDTNIEFTAPLIHLMKHEIIQLAIDLDVPLDLVTSCYYPKMENHKVIVCRKCGCCQVRDATFKMIGSEDPQKTGNTKKLKKRTEEETIQFIKKYIGPFI